MTIISFEEVFSKSSVQSVLEFLEQKPDSVGSDGLPLSQLREYWIHKHPKEHFRQNDDGGVYLNDEGKRLFIDELYYHLYQKQKDGERMVSFEKRYS